MDDRQKDMVSKASEHLNTLAEAADGSSGGENATIASIHELAAVIYYVGVAVMMNPGAANEE